MTRKKMKLLFINNCFSRKAEYKRRKTGLMKKVSELTTLCGIDACAIIYSTYYSRPEVWPNPAGVKQVLAQFKRMPEMEENKKMMNQESFINQLITKASEQLKKQYKENREKEITHMFKCMAGRAGQHNLNLRDLHDFGWVIDEKLKEIYERITSLKKPDRPSSSSSSQIVPAEVDTGVTDFHQQEENPAMNLTMAALPKRGPCFAHFMNNPNPMGFDGPGQMNMHPLGDQQPNAIRPVPFFFH